MFLYIHKIGQQNSTNEQQSINSVHAYGEALKQAQVGLETALIVDGRAASNPNDDVKVVVTSMISDITNI